MLKKLFLTFICTIVSFNAFAQGDTLTDLQNNTYAVTALKGKWVIINYWAVWCRPCAMEAPEFNHFYAHLPSDTLLFGVSYDEGTPTELRAAVDKEGIKFPVLTDDPVAALGLGAVNVMPTTFILNPDGKVAGTLQGLTTESTLNDQLRVLKAEYNRR